jgi:hypothetical protein
MNLPLLLLVCQAETLKVRIGSLVVRGSYFMNVLDLPILLDLWRTWPLQGLLLNPSLLKLLWSCSGLLRTFLPQGAHSIISGNCFLVPSRRFGPSIAVKSLTGFFFVFCSVRVDLTVKFVGECSISALKFIGLKTKKTDFFLLASALRFVVIHIRKISSCLLWLMI